jgi:hypothetical protein
MPWVSGQAHDTAGWAFNPLCLFRCRKGAPCDWSSASYDRSRERGDTTMAPIGGGVTVTLDGRAPIRVCQ